jgi:hypothetical protein
MFILNDVIYSQEALSSRSSGYVLKW